MTLSVIYIHAKFFVRTMLTSQSDSYPEANSFGILPITSLCFSGMLSLSLLFHSYLLTINLWRIMCTFFWVFKNCINIISENFAFLCCNECKKKNIFDRCIVPLLCSIFSKALFFYT